MVIVNFTEQRQPSGPRVYFTRTERIAAPAVK
jgi:hypothetical protein